MRVQAERVVAKRDWEVMTKKDAVAFFKEKLRSDAGWAIKGMLRVYTFQTASEQNMLQTQEANNVGFTAFDAEILSSFAQQYKTKKFLSPKQMTILHKLMPKYAGQLYNCAKGTAHAA